MSSDVFTTIESFGSTSLVEEGSNYFLQPDGGPAVELSYGGSLVVDGEFSDSGEPWEPIGAEQTATGYEVAWKVAGEDEYTVWYTDASGNYLSSAFDMASGSSATLESFESSFQQDLNGDGVIGIPSPVQTIIETNGSTSLFEDGSNYFLQPNGGQAVELSYGGSPVIDGEFDQFGGHWTPIGAEQTATGYEVAWKVAGADEYTVWYTDASGNYLSSAFDSASGSSATLESFEPSFQQDLNGDGVIGIPSPVQTIIETNGSTSLFEDGSNYFLQPNGGQVVELSYGGSPVIDGEFDQYGGHWTPIGAEQTAAGYEVAWKVAGADEYTVWYTDASGNYLSSAFDSASGSSATLESFEPSFQQDLNGDGVIGVNTSGAGDEPQFVYEGTDSAGAQLYDVTWDTLGSHPFAVRVLTPTHPSSDHPHSFLFDLPVEPGLDQSTYGNGLDELAKLDVEDQYNATIIEPIFPTYSWYADNPNDPTIDYETFVASILTQWVDSNFSTTGNEKNLLIGFSKSGYGALDLLLKHPDTFDAAAAFDFPADMTSYEEYGASADYGTQANFQNNYELSGAFIDSLKAPFTTQDRILISEGPVFATDVADFDALLTSQGVAHTLLTQTDDLHSWSGGWLSDAVAGLYGLEGSTPLVTASLADDSGASSGDGITSDDALKGSADPGATVDLTIDGVANAATATADATGAWTFTPTGLADGMHTVVASETNGSDRTGSASLTFTLDTTPPSAPTLLDASAGGYVNAANDTSSQTLGGTAEAGSTVEVYLNGATQPAFTTAADGSGNWSITLGQLADGSDSYTGTATDAAGNVSAAGGPLAFTVDTQAPSGPSLSDSSAVNGYVNAADDTTGQTLGGTAEAGGTINVYLNGATQPAFTTTADGSGDWSVTIGQLADGNYSYTATATDAAGNVSVAGGPLAFTVDTTPPTQPAITSAAPSGGLWNLSGSADAGSTVTIYDGGTKLGTTLANSSGAWAFPTNENNSAIRNDSVTATDAAGNTSVASADWLEGTPGNDIFSFGSMAALAAPAAIFGNGGSDRIKITAPATLTDLDFANAQNILTLALTGASAVALGADAAAAGVGTVATGKGATSIADSNTGILKVNATALAAGAALTLSGSERFTVTGLQGNLAATNVTGALNVTTLATAALTIAAGEGSDKINASAMTQGETLTLTGSHAATVNVGGNLSAGAYTVKLTVTASGTAPHIITTGGGKDSITAASGGDTIAAGGGADTVNVSGHTVADSFVYKSVSDSPNTATGHDTIAGFLAGSGAGAINDVLDFSAILGPTYSVHALSGASAKVSADSIGWIYNAVADQTLVYANTTAGALSQTSGKLIEVALAGDIHVAAANLIG